MNPYNPGTGLSSLKAFAPPKKEHSGQDEELGLSMAAAMHKKSPESTAPID